MKSKKSTILVTAMSISLVLSTQTSMASELGNQADSANNLQGQSQVQVPGRLQSNEQIQNDVTQEQPLEQQDLGVETQNQQNSMPEARSGNGSGEAVDTMTTPTYYSKANWEARIRDKSRWKVEDIQTLVRVTTSDPVQMNDIDYDGMYINSNGRYVIRLIYKEKTQAVSSVWKRALINFGELDQYIDFSNSYVLGRDGKTRYTFDPVTGIKGRGFDLGKAVGDRTNNRKNLPINLVLKDGVTLETLPKQNYIVQMRLTDDKYERVYSYAPGKTSMDYSTYTKTTSVSLDDNLNNLFIKGGLQNDSNNATNQEFFMSEFIANPEQYKDVSNIGIIRTQYMGQRAGSAASPTVGDNQIAFTQVFDANLLNYLKEDDDGNVAYLNVLTVGREVSPYAHKFGIKRKQINKIKVEGGNELAYLVIGTEDFKKDGVEVVRIPQHDQYTMLSGFYITAIDYIVDKSKFEDSFAGRDGTIPTRKLNYSTMSGWTNPNTDGWLVYKKKFDNDFVVQEGDTFMVDAGADAKGKQIMIQVGGEQAILRRPQGYYNGYNSGKAAIDNFEEIADGIFEFTIREGTTVLKEKDLKIYMPYTSSFVNDDKINFLQIHNGTKLNEGAANLKLQKDRNINMHLYKPGKKGYFVLKYTLKDGSESSLRFDPKITWSYDDKDGVMTGAANKATLASGGNFYIDTTKLKPGKDIIVESYDNKGNKIDSETSWFKYVAAPKSDETVKLLTWTDHSDNKSVLSINKSLYTPYQMIFTNDYEEGNAYVDPRKVVSDYNKFNIDTTRIVGYTKYDGGKVRVLYEGPQKLYAKVEADSNEYDDKGNLKGGDKRKDITIPKKNIFDAQFDEESKTYKAYEYTVDLTKMLPYHSDDKTTQELKLLKDMKFVATASDGSSLPSDLYETRVRARVLFDTTDGAWAGNKNRDVKIVPDNLKFYGEEGYKANGFEGESADTSTGDKFPEAPTPPTGKNFLGWVTEEGKTKLGKTIVSAEKFNNLTKDQIFTNTTPVTKHLIVYAIYSEDTVVNFDANGGFFQGGKDEVSVKTEGNNVTKPDDPTKDGYTFKGWATTKDAKTPDVTDFNNITESKTVYAVWEKEADKTLSLNNPEIVPVKDKTDLTNDEKNKVKDAVILANSGLELTRDDITVASDGKVNVTKDGKTGEILADKTVKQKEVLNDLNPPEKPIEVKNKNSLDDDEKNKVKLAVIAANPDLKLKPEEINVDEKGNVTIEQGGKVGSISADKTVVEESKIIKLEKPEKVEVKDINNLTEAEKAAVAEAVKEANKSLPDTAKITVDGNGNVTVVDGDKTGKLEGSDTVKLFDRTGKAFNKNIDKTEVSDLNNLTEAEKEAVREAVKAANPDLHFKNKDIKVSENGTVTVPMGKNSDGTPRTETIDPEKTVKRDDTKKTISLKAPNKTYVVDPTSLTEEEKDTVLKKFKKANDTLPEGTKVEIANDGSISVTLGEKTGSLSQADTVVRKLDTPKIVSDVDGKTVIGPKDDRTKKIEITFTPNNGSETTTITAEKDADGKWKLSSEVEGITVDKKTGVITIPADKIQNNTEVKAVAKDGDNTSDSKTVTSKDTKAPANPEISEDADGNVSITIPKDKDTKSVTVKYTDADGKLQTVKFEKDGDAWKLPTGAPEGLKVENGKIIIPEANVKNGSDVTAMAEDNNKNQSSELSLKIKTTADKTEPVVPSKTKVGNPNNLTDDEKAAVKKAVEDANKGKFPEGTKVEVGDDGTVTITYPDKSVDTIKGSKVTEEKSEEEKTTADKTEPVVPSKTKVGNPNNLTDDEKAAVKKAVEDANKGKFPEGTEVEVGDDGTVTITYPDKSVDTIKGSKVTEEKSETGVETEIQPPEAPITVDNSKALSADDKAKLRAAVRKANPKLPEGAKIEVADDGTVTVKDKDGKVLGTIKSENTVKQNPDKLAVKEPSPVEVEDPDNLTDADKAKVKNAIKNANEDLNLNDNDISFENEGIVKVTKDNKSAEFALANLVKKAGKATGENGNVNTNANANANGSNTLVNNSKPSNQKGNKGVNTGDESTTGILATFIASITALFALKRRKKDEK